LNVSGEFLHQLTELAPSTEYEYFAFVATPVDTVYGEGILFTTLRDTWVPDYTSEVAIRLAPNPANEYVKVIIDNNTMNFDQIQLLRLTGENLGNYPINGQSTRINLADIPTGIYLLYVSNSNGQKQVLKLIKREID
jgi:hypothetical protein